MALSLLYEVRGPWQLSCTLQVGNSDHNYLPPDELRNLVSVKHENTVTSNPAFFQGSRSLDIIVSFLLSQAN